MIVLKILLYILLAVLGIVLLLFILPVKAEASFIDEKFRYKVKFSVIPVMDSEGRGIMGWLKKRRGNDSGDDDEDWEELPEYNDSPDTDDKTDAVHDTLSADNVPVTDTAEENTAAETESESAETVPDEDSTPKKKKSKKKKKKKVKEPKTLGEKVEMLLDLWRAADRPLLKIFKGFRFYDLYIDFIIANEDAYKCALNYGRISGLVYNLLGFMSTLFTVRLQTIDVNAGFGLEKSRWDAAAKVSFRLGTLVIAGVWFLITYIFRYFLPGLLQSFRRKRTAARQK